MVNSFELPFSEYLAINGNYDSEYLSTGLASLGYFDNWNLDTKDLNGTRLSIVESNRDSLLDPSSFKTGYKTYSFMYRLPTGIFNCIKPLGPNHEVKISFERAPSELSLIAEKAENENPLKGKSIELRNVFCKTKYISSQYLRDQIRQNETQDYKFDEISVYQKNLPIGEISIRIQNIIGGQTPNYIFAGIVPAKAFHPDETKSLTKFGHYGVEEFSFTVNGQIVNGFPLSSVNENPFEVYEAFLETTCRKFNTNASNVIAPYDFKMMHYIYAYKFEEKSDGWIGVTMKLKQAFMENHILGLILYVCEKNSFYFSNLDFTRRCHQN